MRHTFALIVLASVLLVGCSREGADWTAAQSANTIESYQEFLKQHPDSAHGLQAQASINQLTEDRDWQQAAAADTREAYEQFVAAHADSKMAQEARVRVENLSLGGASTAGSSSGSAGTATPSGPVTPEQAQAAAAVPGSGMTPQVASQTKVAAAAAAKTTAPAAKPAPSAKPAPGAAMMAMKPSATSKGSQLVQLGSFGSRARAEAQWKLLETKAPTQLKGEEPRYEPATVKGKSVVRLQTSVASADKAHALCTALKSRGQPCLLVQH